MLAGALELQRSCALPPTTRSENPWMVSSLSDTNSVKPSWLTATPPLLKDLTPVLYYR
jgi:hypothetical protein